MQGCASTSLTGLVSLCPHRKALGFRMSKGFSSTLSALQETSAAPACPAAAPPGVARHTQPPAARGAGTRAPLETRKHLRWVVAMSCKERHLSMT